MRFSFLGGMDHGLFIRASSGAVFNRYAAEIFKHAIPGYLVGGTDHFSLRLLNKKVTTANPTMPPHVNDQDYTDYIFFLKQIGKKCNIFVSMLQNLSNEFMCARG